MLFSVGDHVTQKKGECPCCYIEDKLRGSVIFCVGMTEHQTTVTKLTSSTHTCSYLHKHHSAGNYLETLTPTLATQKPESHGLQVHCRLTHVIHE